MDGIDLQKSMKFNNCHRKRLVSALNHKRPDRIPVTLGSPSCSLHKTAQSSLLEYLGFSQFEPALITDNILQIVETDSRLIDYLNIDLLWLLPKEADVVWVDDGNSYIDDFGREFRLAGGFFNQIAAPLKECSDNLIKKYKFPKLSQNRFSHLGAKAYEIYQQGYGLGIDGPWGLYEISSSLMGTTEFLMNLILNPSITRKLAERVLEEYLVPFYDLLLADTADLVNIIGISDDLGSQTGLLFSPKIYREIFKPLHQKLISHIRSKTDAKIYLHSDGSIYPIIPDLIEIGVDGLNPVQYTAHNMSLTKLVNEFGDDMGFFGGVIENSALSFSTPSEIRRLVKENISILKRKHAFIFAPIHNISQEVPPKNILALFQAAID